MYLILVIFNLFISLSYIHIFLKLTNTIGHVMFDSSHRQILTTNGYKKNTMISIV